MLNKATDIINQRRISARIENEKRFQEIEAKIPEIAEINRILSHTSIEIIKAIHSGEERSKKIKELENHNIQAQKLTEYHLKSKGYPADYLEIKYTCSRCSDTGYYKGRRCSCFDDLVGKLAVNSLNETSPLKLCSFETFNLSYYRGISTMEDDDCYTTMYNNFQYCRKYASSFSKNSENIFISGKTGLGKTHLSLAIAKTLLEKGWNVLYDSIINFLDKIADEHFGRSKDTNTLSIIMNVDLLIMDDLGTEQDTSFYTSTVYNIINTRLNKGLPTIISTNLTPKEVEKKYDPRIASRLFTMYDYLKFTGKDVRSIKASQKSKEVMKNYNGNRN